MYLCLVPVSDGIVDFVGNLSSQGVVLSQLGSYADLLEDEPHHLGVHIQEVTQVGKVCVNRCNLLMIK